MSGKRGLLILSVPVLGISLLGAALVLRREREGPPLRRAVPQVVADPKATPAPRVPAAVVKPVPPSVIARATDRARVQAMFQSYRTAVATDNRVIQDALRPALLEEREMTLQYANEELSRAREAYDREIAQRTLESLRR